MRRFSLIIGLSGVFLAVGCQHQVVATKQPPPTTSVLLHQEGLRPLGSLATGLENQGWVQTFSSENPEVEPLLATLANRQWRASINLASQYLSKHPFAQEAFLVLATAHSRLEEYDQAAFYARRALQRNPESATALNLLGLCVLAQARSLADHRHAQQLFARAFKMDPHDLAAGLNLGYLQLELGASAAAHKTFTALSQRCVSCQEVQYGAAIALNRLGKHTEAKQLFESIVKTNPTHLTSWYQLALYYRNVKNDQEKSQLCLDRILKQPKVHDFDLVAKARRLQFSSKSLEAVSP